VQLFNGDFVDRGSFSVECILTLFSFKLLYPNHFFMSRGKLLTPTSGSRRGAVAHPAHDMLLVLLLSPPAVMCLKMLLSRACCHEE